AVKVTRDAEFDRRAFERVVFGLLDAGLAVGRTCAYAFTRHAVDSDCGGRGDEVPHLNDAADSVAPISDEAVGYGRNGRPLDIVNIMGLAVAVAPTLALLGVFLPYAFSQSFEKR